MGFIWWLLTPVRFHHDPKKHTFITTSHTHAHTASINGHKFDPWQAWHMHPRGLWSLCFSWPLLMQHTLTCTHTLRQALLSHSFLPLTHLSSTSLTPDPAPLGTVIDFSSDPLNLGWRRVRTGELVAIVRYNGGDAEDEGERSMRADGWACSSRNNSQPWRKSKGLEARWVSNTDEGERGETVGEKREAGGQGEKSSLLSYVTHVLSIYWLLLKTAAKMVLKMEDMGEIVT